MTRHDHALRLPPDPRQAGRDVIAEGWACRMPTSAGLCGLPKPPHAEHCGRPRCVAAWELQQDVEAAHAEAVREDREWRRERYLEAQRKAAEADPGKVLRMEAGR